MVHRSDELLVVLDLLLQGLHILALNDPRIHHDLLFQRQLRSQLGLHYLKG